MIAKYLTQNDFFDEYIKLYATRFTMGSLRIEDGKTNLTSKERAIEMYNNMKAITQLIKTNPEKLSPYDVINVAEIINQNLNFFDRGFRKVQVEVRGAPFFPTAPKDITSEMYSLFDCYYNVWNILPAYEREARFHIKFIHIHPFEDGNGRTGRILTGYNLCRDNKAPIVIDSKERKKYFEYINKNDVDNLALLFEKKSKEEFEVMLNLYETICGNKIENITQNSIVDEHGVKIYEMSSKKRNK